jgi:hypothetical protein
MKQIIRETLDAKLTGLTYQSENTSRWTKEIANAVTKIPPIFSDLRGE